MKALKSGLAQIQTCNRRMDDDVSTSKCIDQLEKDLVEALQNAADASIPVVGPTSHQHKDNWYYCPDIKELNARMNRIHKIFGINPTEEIYELLKEVATHVSTEMDAIRHDK